MVANVKLQARILTNSFIIVELPSTFKFTTKTANLYVHYCTCLRRAPNLISNTSRMSTEEEAPTTDNTTDNNTHPDSWSFQYNVEDASTDVELLRRAWKNEKIAPEILSFQLDLIQRSREQIQLMEDTIEGYAESGSDDVMLSLYHMDLDRMLFLLRSYLRIRLQKIEKHVLHILMNEELWGRLSRDEHKFAERYTDAIQKHLDVSVLTKLPPGYGSLAKQAASSDKNDMVPEPQLDTFVFCKSKRPMPSFQMDDKGEETVDLVADDLHILRYKPIKRLVETGQIDLV